MSTIRPDLTEVQDQLGIPITLPSVFDNAFEIPEGASQEIAVIAERRQSALLDFLLPTTRWHFQLRVAFNFLVRQWRQETLFHSSVPEITSAPAFRQIVRLGWDVVPFILREISNNPDYLVAALLEITGEDAVRDEHRGNINLMARAWTEWADAKCIPY